MIDKIVLQIPFAAPWVTFAPLEQLTREFVLNQEPWAREVAAAEVNPAELPFSKSARSIFVNEQGGFDVEDIVCPWESLPSSHGGLAVKCFHRGNGHCGWPYVVLKCSPAKLVQGHNVYGSDDMGHGVSNMLWVLQNTYPALFGGFKGDDRGPMLDFKNSRISEFDITYSVRIPCENQRRAFIQCVNQISKGQTKPRGDGYDGATAYFGSKTSRLTKQKIYDKALEILHDQGERIKHNKRHPSKPKKLIPQEVINWAEGVVRFEATIKKEWMERRGIPTGTFALVNYLREDRQRYRSIWAQSMKNLFSALDGQTVTVMNEKSVISAIDKVHGQTRGKTARMYGFYQAIKAVGLKTLKAQYPKSTYCRMVSDLEACGFSRATLQNLHRESAPILKVATLVNLENVGEIAPEGYKIPNLYEAA